MKLRTALQTMAFCIALVGENGQAGPASLSDAQILGIYTQVNSFDIETALLGKSKGCSKGVKHLAMHLSTDHLAVRKAVLELAKQEGIDYVLPAARIDEQIQHNEVMAKLSALTCPEFDNAFLKHDVAFHTAAIDAVKNILIPNTQNQALKNHFLAVLPAFEKHLSMTKAAANDEYAASKKSR